MRCFSQRFVRSSFSSALFIPQVPLESVLPPPPTALPSVSAAAVYTTKHGVDFVVNYQQPSTTTTALDSTVIKSMDEFLSELLVTFCSEIYSFHSVDFIGKRPRAFPT